MELWYSFKSIFNGDSENDIYKLKQLKCDSFSTEKGVKLQLAQTKALRYSLERIFNGDSEHVI